MWFKQRRRKKEARESEKALREAQSHLEAVKQRDEEVKEEAKIQKELRERNGFIDQFTIIFGGGHPHGHH